MVDQFKHILMSGIETNRNIYENEQIERMINRTNDQLPKADLLGNKPKCLHINISQRKMITDKEL